MIQEKRFLFLRSVRILYQGENLARLADNYDYATVISYQSLNLKDQGFTEKRKSIANIYLDRPIGEVFNGFSVSTRNEIHKTEKMPELTFIANDNASDESYRLYSEFERWQGRTPWKKNSFWGTLLFNAYWRGIIIATIACYDLHPYLQIKSISSNRMEADNKEFYKIISIASRRLVYEICKYGKEEGYTFVGLGSVSEATPQKAGVAKFKKFFGPAIENEYTYTYQSARFRFFDNLRKSLGRVPL
jgi:hypothetical protein